MSENCLTFNTDCIFADQGLWRQRWKQRLATAQAVQLLVALSHNFFYLLNVIPDCGFPKAFVFEESALVMGLVLTKFVSDVLEKEKEGKRG